MHTYAYDSLNRLLSATENVTPTGGSASQSWKQTFTYDRYGNRNFDQANTTMPASFSNPAVSNPSVSTTNNRLTSTGYSYDNAGNTLTDAGGKTYTYDAENKQVQVNSGATILGQYYYDGDGKRVKKYVPGTGETTIFIYDAAGKEIAEYSTIVEGTSTAKVNYLTNDHLGSPRINTDANGAIIARHDYHPFGEEINGVGGRTTGLNYGSDTVRKQFTGYERDGETGLDFAQARMYVDNLGRFNSADPYNIVLESQAENDVRRAKQKLNTYLDNPGQWNRYVYVGNNPTRYTDSTGEILELTGTPEERDRAFQRLQNLLGPGAGLSTITQNGHTYVGYNRFNGGLAGAAGDIGQVIQDLINTNTLVEYQVTRQNVVKDALGTEVNLQDGFAKTQLINENRIQIFVKDGSSGDLNMKARKESAADWGNLVFTDSVQDAHEYGHAWGAVTDHTFDKIQMSSNKHFSRSNLDGRFQAKYGENYADPKEVNNQRSVQVENWQRDRLGLSHRTHH